MLWVWCLCLFFIVISTVLVNQHASFRRSVDWFFYDMMLRHKPAVIENQVAVIEIDDKSIIALGRWPWSRTVHAQLVEKVAEQQPKSVFLDILFTEPSAAHADDALAKAFKKSNNVVLPVLLAPKHGSVLDLSDLSNIDVYDPIPLLSQAVVVGHVGNQPDWDSIIRNTQMNLQVDGRALYNVMALMAKTQPADNHLLIPYRGEAGQFQHYSYIDVLEGRISPLAFKDRYVLIGASASGLGDINKTPFGLMPGVEIHANILSAILKNDFIKPASLVTQVSIEIALVVLLMLGFLALGERWYLIVLIGCNAIFIGFSLGLLYFKNLWLSPVVGVVMSVLAYIFWSWWQMFAAFRYLRLELATVVPDLSDTSAHGWFYRFEKVRNIVYTLQKAQQQQRQVDSNNRELIEFLSHDMRTPQINILSALSVYRKQHPDQALEGLFGQIELNVSNTIGYSQSLIEFNRIQKITLNLEELNLQHLVNYAIERIYVQAQHKNIKIVFECETFAKENAWVRVDGALMERALLNVMSNAIRYSPPNSVIQIGLTVVQENHAFFGVVSVTDQGEGIDEGTKALLLSGAGIKKTDKRTFSDGSVSLGIGWRIVHSIVVQRHKGFLDIKTAKGQGTTVFIKLPLVVVESANMYDHAS